MIIQNKIIVNKLLQQVGFIVKMMWYGGLCFGVDDGHDGVVAVVMAVTVVWYGGVGWQW